MKISFIKKFRLLVATILKSPSYFDQFTNQIYKTYLNHNKIIHFRDGFPVYSLSTPALYSKPAANLFSRLIFRVIQNRNLPNLMSFAVTGGCNLNCKHCSFFDTEGKKKGKEMTLKQCIKAIKDSQDLGVSIINILGGEPLVREDILEIIGSINKDLSTVILFTNGWHLAKKADSLKKAGLDGVYVSIDSADKSEHDDRRNKEGVFERAFEGIKKAKEAGLTVGISCCVGEEEFEKGKLDEIVELAKREGIHEVLVFDTVPTGKLSGCKKLIDNQEWVEGMIESVAKYNEDDSYPGILIYSYATSFKSTGCSGGASYFYVSPYGDISPCDFNHATFGNLLETPLYEIWDKMSSIELYQKAVWGGCKLKRSKYRDSEYVSTKGYKRIE